MPRTSPGSSPRPITGSERPAWRLTRSWCWSRPARDFDQIVRPSALIAALLYAADIDADVVNMSWGVILPKTGVGCHFLSAVVAGMARAAIMTACRRAANYAHEHGVTMVASAGNGGMDFDHLLGYWFRFQATCPT